MTVPVTGAPPAAPSPSATPAATEGGIRAATEGGIRAATEGGIRAATEGGIPAATEAPRLGLQPLLTTHRVFEAFDAQKKSLGILHGDLFDSRQDVALSALAAVGKIADPRSFPYVTRLLAGAQEDVQEACLRALGAIRHPDVPRLLKDFTRSTRSDRIRREILSALAASAPHDKDVVAQIRLTARGPLGSAGGRAHAAALFLNVAGEIALEELLTDGREEVLDQVIASALENPALRPRTLAHCAPLYARLPARNRSTLVALATGQLYRESAAILRSALADPNAEVRRAAYAVLGTESHQAAWFTDIVSQMAMAVESNPSLEDEAQAAITRMSRVPDSRTAVLPAARATVMSRVSELFKQLRATGRKMASDSHELGWLIMRSTEYLEYYGDEDLKASLLRWLRGTSTDTADGLMKMLKATAVRVEVKHFDGYSALADLIKNPKRNGIGLVARELSLAHTGKAHVLWQLGRVIRLSTVFLAPGGSVSDGALMKEIYSWAHQEKLYRLAEAALAALAKVDIPAAEAACKACLTLPLASKVLAIASLHLVRELNLALLEPAAARLLASQDDPYVTLNALECVSSGPPSTSGDLAKALLTRFSMDCSREVRDALTSFLGEKIAVDVTESLKEHILSGGEERRASALAVLDRRIKSGLVANRDGTVELLYRVLRGDHQPSRQSAALMLWRLGDDYASEVLRDFLISVPEDTAADLLRRLQGMLREPLLSGLSLLLRRDGKTTHEALRELLLRAEDGAVRERALQMALEIRGDTAEEESDEGLIGDAEAVEVRSERSSYQFERENMEELVILFTDIQGYSKKAQVLSPMQIAALLQEYEKILLSHVESHHGELVKRMGDGHMFVFHAPLPAVLAAIRLQKSLRRFNRYRDENNRVVIRIGIHSGSVVRKGRDDVLGNAVNIASRLESSARPGSVLISDRVEEGIKDYVHVREIGRITVKNISEPIRVFEPYEIVLDLPAELDPLKAGPVGSAVGSDGGAAGRIVMDREVYAEILRCFSALAAVCRQSPNGQVGAATLNEHVLQRWGRLRPRLPGLSPAKKA